MFLKRWKINKLIERKKEIASELYDLENKSSSYGLKYKKLCRRKRGNTEYAITLRKAKILIDQKILSLKDEYRLIELEMKTFST